MKKERVLVYPVVISADKTDKYYDVYIPDLEIFTEGKSIADAIDMARDAIGVKCMAMEDDLKQELPSPSELHDIEHSKTEFVTLVDINYTEYKIKYSNKTVRRNVTLPAYLDHIARESGINVSAVLQNALKAELHV